MVSTTPAYNLKVVLKETGLAADTLRAWERRYGLPVPQRTAGGHRLYSQRDIETIKWLMKRQADGLSISRAVDMYNDLLASGSDPLEDSVQPSLTSAVTTQYQSPETTLDSSRERWVRACIDFNESNAEQTLNQAFSIFPVEAVCVEVLQKGLSEIGRLWYENRASVQQEHFASGLAMRRLDALLSATPAPTRNATLLVGCAPDEWHVFTPLLLSLLLRRRGSNVIFLGANVPTTRFADTIKKVKADLVVLVAQQLTSAATLQQTALALASQNIRIAYGGRIFNLHAQLPDSISGTFLGYDLNSAMDEIDVILNNKVKQPQSKNPSQMYATAYQAFISKRLQIDMTVKELFETLSISPEDMNIGIHFLSENITAALQLGDMSYVSAEVDWLRSLLQSYDTPPQQLIHFMEVYSQAIDRNINGQGQPIFEWLASEVEKLKDS
jgi:MerR family transcriptional regulator, light-induced transcriptional regulator